HSRALLRQRQNPGGSADERTHAGQDGQANRRREGISRVALQIPAPQFSSDCLLGAKGAGLLLHRFRRSGQQEKSPRVVYMAFTVNGELVDDSVVRAEASALRPRYEEVARNMDPIEAEKQLREWS